MTVLSDRGRDLLGDIPTLSPILGIPKADVMCLCSDIYNTFELKPRNSHKTRTIDAPCPHLKLVQRALLDRILAHVMPHDAAMAFVQGKSIATNARRHHGSQYLFKTDIQSFFSSITGAHVRSMLALRFRHLSVTTIQEIVTLVTRENRLPQGAPTSPHLANLVMLDFDERNHWLSGRLGAVYTRYADDISISACDPNVLRNFEGIIRDGLYDLGMEIHSRKSRHLGPHQRKTVTGLDISSERIRPTRAFRKKTSALVRMATKYPEKMDGNGDRLRGYLAFWYGIDPADQDLARLLNQLGLSGWAKKVVEKAESLNPHQIDSEAPF